MTRTIDKKLERDIQDDAVRRLPTSRRRKSNLFVNREVLKKGNDIFAHRQKIPVSRDTVFVFADDEPHYNWAHDCRYLLYDSDNGQMYREIHSRFPPYLIDPPDTYVEFHKPVVIRPDQRFIWPITPKLKWPMLLPKGKRYAVLFSGASNNRHTNDLEFFYRTLVGIYSFNPDDIFVLNYDGTLEYSGGPKPVSTWPGDGTAYQMPVHGQGTKSDLEGVLDDLKNKLLSDDLLLIHTNNHGGHDGSTSYLCTYSGNDYTVPDFANKLGSLPAIADLMVVMEQCHSGGFNDMVIEASTAQRTTFAAACTENRSSIGGADFDPYARDWIAAMAGADPYGADLLSTPDTSGEGRVSALEAFAYADSIHDDYDTPVYTARGTGAGDQYMAQKWRFLSWWRDIVLHELKPVSSKGLARKEMGNLLSRMSTAIANTEDELERSGTKPSDLEERLRSMLRKVL